MSDEDTPTPTGEWDEVAATILTGVPLDALDAPPPEPIPAENTAPHSIPELPGYDPGVRRGIDEALTAFRLAQIQGGTDPGIAHLMAEKLGRWMKVPVNAELIREALKPG
jgi:hypothetical protein